MVSRISNLDLENLQQVFNSAPPGPWMYTGGLENRRGLVRRLAAHRPLWGNSPAALRRARDPLFISHTLQEAGLPAPAVHREPAHLGTRCRWLHKPIQGAGGAGICLWEGQSAVATTRPAYFQEFVEGQPCAAAYVGDGYLARFLGLTIQLVGTSWLHAAPFHYCGSIGPLILAEGLHSELEQVGSVLAERCGLVGLFGVDGILRDGVFLPLEINPRYTASVEVLEYATGLMALVCHRLAFSTHPLSRADDKPAAIPANQPGGCVGKAILFADRDVLFPPQGPWLNELENPTPLTALPSHADIPAAGQFIPRGRPVLTFFSRADSPAACEARLQRIALDLDHWLFRG
jgi:predicted ATP-grasp superfamily ATP-dependent carboligase